MKSKVKTLIGHLAAGGAYTIFGLNIVFCKDIANSAAISPMVLFTLRAIGASAVFWLLSALRPAAKIERGDMWKIAIAAFLGLYTPQLTFLFAITMSTSIDTSVVSTLSPVFTMLIAALFLKEPITLKKAGGVALSLIGVLALIFNSVARPGSAEHTTAIGFVLLFLNCISFAAYLGIFRPLIAKYDVITFMKWMFLFALAYSLPFSAKGLVTTDYASIPPLVLWEIGYLIVFATLVAYFLIPVGQKYIRPTLVAMYSYLQPIIAALVSICIGMDHFTWLKATATLLVFAGVWIVNKSRAA